MKKLLFCALIMQPCPLSYAMDIIELPVNDLRSPDVHTTVLLHLIKSLSATNKAQRQALARIQHVLDHTYKTLEQSQSQLMASHKQVRLTQRRSKTTSKL